MLHKCAHMVLGKNCVEEKIMKKRTVIVISVIAAACIVLGAIGIIAANAETRWYKQKEETDAYAFPEYDGEEAVDWMSTVDFYQIPEDVLKVMSTDGLIEACLDYPLYSAGMIFSNESVYAGFLRTRSEFNGLQELFKRKDAPDKLVRLYREVSPDKAYRSDDSASLRMRYLQYIIAQDEVLNGLSTEGRKQLLDECMNKVEQYYTSHRDVFALDPALMIAARICKRDCEAFRGLMVDEPWMESFAATGIMVPNDSGGLQKAFDVINGYRREK